MTYEVIKVNADETQKEIKKQTFRKANKKQIPNFCVVNVLTFTVRHKQNIYITVKVFIKLFSSNIHFDDQQKS